MSQSARLVGCCLAATIALIGSSAKADHIGSWVVPDPGPPDGFFDMSMNAGIIGGPVTQVVSGPLRGSGAILTDIDFDAAMPWTSGPGNGTFRFIDTHLTAMNVTNVFVDLGPGGSVEVDLIDVGMSINSSDIPVASNVWTLEGFDPPESMTVSLNSGSIVIHNLIGPVNDFISDPEILDFAATPISFDINDLLGLGVGGTADNVSISARIRLPFINISEAVGAPTLVFASAESQIYLAKVPEPTSLALLAMGCFALVAHHRRRR